MRQFAEIVFVDEKIEKTVDEICSWMIECWMRIWMTGCEISGRETWHGIHEARKGRGMHG
jgi:hypothetical protein